MANYSGSIAVSETLAASTVDYVTLSNPSANGVTILNRTGTAEIYITYQSGTSNPTAPTVGEALQRISRYIRLLFDLVPQEEPIDMTDLFDKVMAAKWPHAVFPIREYWVDIGRHSDLNRATIDFDTKFR